MPVNGSTTPTFTSCACAMQAEKASAAEAARTRLNIHFLPKILETRAGNSGGPVSGRIVGRKPETGQANGPPERPVTMRLFGADHVGSYLRTDAIHNARAKREKGEISAEELKKVEDEEIPKVIKKQEAVGLQCATDGEYRRMFWHFDFYDGLEGVEIYELDHGIQFQGVQTKPKSIRVTGKIDFSNHPMLEHFKFLKANTKVMPKMCIPSPTVLHFRLEPGAVDKKTYANNDAIFSDLSAAYRKAVKAFYDAGCRYLQFDDTAWAYLCSPAEMKSAKARGINTDRV